MNLPLPKELPSGTLTKRIAQLRKVCKIKKQISTKGKKKKYNENLRDYDGILRDGSSLLVSGNEFTIAHFI